MPAGVVKTPKDERHWNKAKALAAQQGRPKDYAYIMGIYKKMSGLTKSYPYNAPPMQRAPYPLMAFVSRAGPLPQPGKMNAASAHMRQLTAMPTGMRSAGMLGERLFATPRAIPRDLGLSPADEITWANYLQGLLPAVPDEVNLRQSLSAKMMQMRVPTDVGRAILQRSLSHWRARLGKSENPMDVDSYAADNYVSPEQMQRRADPRGACRQAFFQDVVKPSGRDGFLVTDLKQLLLTYGPEILADILEPCLESGNLTFDGTRFFYSDPKLADIRGEPNLARSLSKGGTALVWVNR